MHHFFRLYVLRGPILRAAKRIPARRETLSRAQGVPAHRWRGLETGHNAQVT